MRKVVLRTSSRPLLRAREETTLMAGGRRGWCGCRPRDNSAIDLDSDDDGVSGENSLLRFKLG